MLNLNKNTKHTPKTMNIHIVSLFPEMFSALHHGIVGRAITHKRLHMHYWNPRDYSDDPHHRIDDRPYGGGPGMVMKVAPLRNAIIAAKQSTTATPTVIYLSPQGKRLAQPDVTQLAQRKELILVSGRYEGIDERLIQLDIDEEWSVGDYIVSGGELPAMLMIDAITRLLPGALGDEESAQQDSFSDGLLDYPHYTRPEIIDDKKVPEVLLSGNHEAISRWRLTQALGRTWQRRPDLLKRRALSEKEKRLLAEYISETSQEEA